MRNTSASLFARTLGVIVCLSLAFPASVPGPDMPKGAGTPKVVHGGAKFQRNGDNLTVTTNSNRTIINWDRFGVPGGSKTHFAQPGRNSATLNRVQGNLPSRVDGTLSSNGSVYITNPNGVVVGAKGVVRTDGGFVASTLDISNAGFIGGGAAAMRFMQAGQGDGMVENHGIIESARGDVYLLGTRVVNTGRVSAAQGTAGLAAGSQVVIHPLGRAGGRVEIIATDASFAGGTGVANSGVVAAAAAELRAHGNAYRLAVNNTGVVKARGVARTPEGRVFLTGRGKSGAAGSVVNAGTVKALNADGSGGAAYITGETVTLAKESLVDVSATRGDGGTALVGGAFQGGKRKDGSELLAPNARNLTVEAGAKVLADGAGAGDGGLAVLWADNHTEFAGHVSARGGQAKGDGGFVEVSGKATLHFAGTADTKSGTGGKTGTLLLDPADVTISNQVGNTIRADDLGTTLAANNVIVYTDKNAPGAGNITVRDPIQWSTSNSLTLLAWNNIIVRERIISEGRGAVTLAAGWDGSTGLPSLATPPLHTGTFTMPTLPTSQSGLAQATWFGNTAGRTAYDGKYKGGIILIADDTISIGANVASRGGTTTLLANDVALLGGAGNPDTYAQIGYKADETTPDIVQAASGDIVVYAKGELTLQGGGEQNAYAQIGHGGGNYLTLDNPIGYTLNPSGASITVLAGGALNITGGGGANAYAKIGHGGSVIGGGGASAAWSNTVTGIDTSVAADSITAVAGSGNNSLYSDAAIGSDLVYAQIGSTINQKLPQGLDAALTIRSTGSGIAFNGLKARIIHTGTGAFSLLSSSALSLSLNPVGTYTGVVTIASEAELVIAGAMGFGGSLNLLSGWDGVSGWSPHAFDPAMAITTGAAPLTIGGALSVANGLAARSGGAIAVNGAVSSGGDGYFMAGTNVTLGSGGRITSTGGSLLVEAKGKFVNNSSAVAASALAAPMGWLVWTGDARGSVANGLSASAATRQFDVDSASDVVSVSYVNGAPVIAKGSGLTLTNSGFLLKGAAPTITVTAKNSSMLFGAEAPMNWDYSLDKTFSGMILGDRLEDVLASVEFPEDGGRYTNATSASPRDGEYFTSFRGVTSSLGYGIKVVNGVMSIVVEPVYYVGDKFNIMPIAATVNNVALPTLKADNRTMEGVGLTSGSAYVNVGAVQAFAPGASGTEKTVPEDIPGHVEIIENTFIPFNEDTVDDFARQVILSYYQNRYPHMMQELDMESIIKKALSIYWMNYTPDLGHWLYKYLSSPAENYGSGDSAKHLMGIMDSIMNLFQGELKKLYTNPPEKPNLAGAFFALIQGRYGTPSSIMGIDYSRFRELLEKHKQEVMNTNYDPAFMEYFKKVEEMINSGETENQGF